MSTDLALCETTPSDGTTAVMSQSATTPDLSAHTLNSSTADVNPSITSTSIASNTSSGVICDQEIAGGVLTADGHHNIQNSASKNCKPERKDDMKRRRTRRARKRRWRLDYRSRRLQWSESTEQEVRRLHMKVLEHGQPLAPYNTTQFIMNEHNSDKDIDFEAIRGRLQRLKRSEDNDHHQSGGANDPDDEDFYSSPEDESDYLQQQFHEAYDNIHAERLSAMNKNELVQEYLQLEDRVEDLERKLKETTSGQTLTPDLRTTVSSEVQTELCSDGLDGQSSTESDIHMTDISEKCHFEQQLQRLSQENQRLRSDNERLKRIVNEQHTTADNTHSSQ